MSYSEHEARPERAESPAAAADGQDQTPRHLAGEQVLDALRSDPPDPEQLRSAFICPGSGENYTFGRSTPPAEQEAIWIIMPPTFTTK